MCVFFYKSKKVNDYFNLRVPINMEVSQGRHIESDFELQNDGGEVPEEKMERKLRLQKFEKKSIYLLLGPYYAHM